MPTSWANTKKKENAWNKAKDSFKKSKGEYG